MVRKAKLEKRRQKLKNEILYWGSGEAIVDEALLELAWSMSSVLMALIPISTIAVGIAYDCSITNQEAAKAYSIILGLFIVCILSAWLILRRRAYDHAIEITKKRYQAKIEALDRVEYQIRHK